MDRTKEIWIAPGPKKRYNHVWAGRARRNPSFRSTGQALAICWAVKPSSGGTTPQGNGREPGHLDSPVKSSAAVVQMQ